MYRQTDGWIDSRLEWTHKRTNKSHNQKQKMGLEMTTHNAEDA